MTVTPDGITIVNQCIEGHNPFPVLCKMLVLSRKQKCTDARLYCRGQHCLQDVFPAAELRKYSLVKQLQRHTILVVCTQASFSALLSPMLALVAIAVALVRVQRLRRHSGSCCPNPSGTARWTQSDREYNELIGTRKRCVLKEQAVGMQTAAVGRHGTCMSLARYRFRQVCLVTACYAR